MTPPGTRLRALAARLLAASALRIQPLDALRAE
jgi:hypothetical protein